VLIYSLGWGPGTRSSFIVRDVTGPWLKILQNQPRRRDSLIPGPQKDDSFLDSQIRTSQIQALANEEVRHGKSNCAAG
jgi:hypothetical protein